VKIQLFWSFYRDYLDAFYARRPGLPEKSFAKQLDELLDDGFGWPPAVVRRLANRGHEVAFAIVNAEPLQRAWAREHCVEFDGEWSRRVGLEQVRQFRPDVLWIGSLFGYFGPYLRELKQYARAVAAWIAVDPPSKPDLGGIDMVLSSHDNFVDQYRALGTRAERLLPAFEPELLGRVPVSNRDLGLCFVGSLTPDHPSRVRLLAELRRAADLELWSPRPPRFVRRIMNPDRFRTWLVAWRLYLGGHGRVFGLDMYEVLARARVVLNMHIDAAGGLAGNMRMFEATGMGALLLTDAASNLGELFEHGREVVAYDSVEDAVAKVQRLLTDDAELNSIARAGQARTLRDHSTVVRSLELERLLQSLL
jgi:spore maturation protein CgeB